MNNNPKPIFIQIRNVDMNSTGKKMSCAIKVMLTSLSVTSRKIGKGVIGSKFFHAFNSTGRIIMAIVK